MDSKINLMKLNFWHQLRKSKSSIRNLILFITSVRATLPHCLFLRLNFCLWLIDQSIYHLMLKITLGRLFQRWRLYLVLLIYWNLAVIRLWSLIILKSFFLILILITLRFRNCSSRFRLEQLRLINFVVRRIPHFRWNRSSRLRRFRP